MNWGSAVKHLAESFRKRVLWHHQGDTTREWNLLRKERHKERIGIARELQDTLLHGFLSAPMPVCLAGDWLPTDLPAKPMLGLALALMRKGINDGRTVGGRSPVLPDGSLEKALLDVESDLAPSERTPFRIVIAGETKPLEPAVHEKMILIAREALLNALQHSQANSVEVEIEYLKRKLRVAVRDNGKGIDPEALQSGQNLHSGLTSMRKRAASIGAKIEVWSKQGVGTEVEISVPIRRVRGPA